MKRLAVLAVLISLIGCRTPTATTPPPVQQTVAQLVKTLADADNAAVRATISLRDSGKLKQADAVVIENWCKTIANIDNAVANEMAGSDTWDVQRKKIALLVAAQALPAVSQNLDPTLQASLSSLLAYVNQIYGAVK